MTFLASIAGPMFAAAAASAASPIAAPLAADVVRVAATAEVPQVWAGHQVALGTKKVPVLGTLETRTDTFVLARLQKTSVGWQLVQEACRLDFAPVGGVTISMDTDSLPKTTMKLRERQDGTFAASSVVRWGSEDLDDDGNPGMTVDVDATLCAGSLYVSSTSTSDGSARVAPRFIGGHVDTNVRQSILGAEGACLSRMAEDTNDDVAGPFAYVPVASDATCGSLAGDWPVTAMP